MEKSSLTYLIKVLVITLLFIYGLDKLVYYGINRISQNVYTGQSGGKINQFFLQKDELELIVFGNSRASHHIEPKSINQNSFNIGVDGTKIAYSAALIKTTPKDLKQIFLVHISPYNAFKEEYMAEDITSLKLFYHQNEIIKNEINLLGQNSLLNSIFWSQTYNGSLLSILKNYVFPQYDYKKYSGYDPLNISNDQKEKFRQLLDKWTPRNCNDINTINPIYLKYIDEIKAFCQINNKELIFYTSPIYRDDCKNDDIALTKFLDDKNITYWNLSDFFANDHSLEFWKDNTHLSSKGAKIFTTEISKRLKNIK